MTKHCSTCGCDPGGEALLTMGLTAAPKAQERARKGSSGHFYTPSGTRDFQTQVGWELKAAGVRPIQTDGLLLDVAFHLKSMKPTKRADFDNYVKSLCDAGNKIAWEDDRQITSGKIDVVSSNGADPFITFSVYEVDKSEWGPDYAA